MTYTDGSSDPKSTQFKNLYVLQRVQYSVGNPNAFMTELQGIEAYKLQTLVSSSSSFLHDEPLMLGKDFTF